MTDRLEMKGEWILRSLARGIAALLLLLPVNSYALGLGDIELHSALNQPLDAEISLISADSVNPDELKVALASSEDFAKAELERPVYLTKIKFAIDHKADGRLYVKVSSEDAMKEPFIDFLVEVDWPDGRLVREYTVLLDPPVLVNDKPAPIAAATTTSAMPEGAETVPGVENTTQAGQQTVRTRDISPRMQTSGGKMQYGPVTRTDTLWSIAARMRPDNSVTIQQVMMALLKNNPDAFYDNNINELKAGYVLRIDDPELITAMSAAEALQVSRAQYQQWLDAKNNAGQSPSQRPVGGEEPAGTMAATSSGEGGAQLKLVAPDSEGAAGAAGSEAANAAQELDSLREQLAVAQETSDVTRQENDELRSRIAALESQLASMQRLVTLKDDTMAAIQGGTEQTGSETKQPGESQTQPTPPANGAEPTPQPQQAVTPPPQAKPTPAPAPAPESAITMLLKDPLTLGLGGLVILVVIVLIWMRIRQRQLAYDGFDEGILAAAEHVADDSDSAIASAVGAFNAESAVDAIESESDEMDVLAEADVYLAYRRFDKAIELLNGALQNEPERNDYKLKLLEVYAESKDIDGFISQAEQLYAAVGTQGGPVWDKVVKMGRRLTPDHPLFSGTDIPGDVDGDDSATNIDDDGHMAMDFTSNRDTADDEPVAVESDTAIEDGFGDIESLDFTEDDAVSDSLDDDALNFDLGGDSDESGTTTIDDDAEDISSPAKTESEPQGEHQNTAGKGPSNVIDFEAGLLSTPAKAAAHETATPETGDFGNAIDFEAGLSAAEKVVEKDASPATDNVDYSDNVLEFDHGPANDESDVADQATGNDRPADGDVAETEVAAVLQEDETRIDDAQGTDAPGTDDDIDWLSNIDDDLSQDGDAVTDADAVEDLISSGDEVDTKLDLAKAYIDMDDKESARGILDEVVTEGSDDQKREAEQLIQQIG